MLAILKRLFGFGQAVFLRLERVTSDPRGFRTAKTIVALAIFSYFLVIIATSLDPDFGWHIKVGNWIIENQQIPRADELSYTMAGYEWVDHEWALNAALAFAYGHGMGWLVVLLFSAMAAAPFIFWTVKSRSCASFFPLVLGALALSGFAYVRPAIVSFFLFFLFAQVIRNKYRSGSLRTLKFFVAVLLLVWVWANLHAGFISGIALLCLAMFYDHARRFLSVRQVDWRKLAYDTALVTASFMVAIANPYGIELYGEIMRIAGSAETHRYIEEWLPAVMCENWKVPLFYVPFAFIAWGFRKRLDKYNLFLSAAMFLLFMGATRNFMPFLIVAMPLTEEGANIMRHDLKENNLATPPVQHARQVLAWVVLAAFAGVILADIWAMFAPGKQEYYPRKAVGILNEYSKTNDVVIFNEYGWGGYLALRSPRLKVFIDGRMPHWKDSNGYSLMEDYIKVSYTADPADIARVFKKWDINTALLNSAPESAKERGPESFWTVLGPIFNQTKIANFLAEKIDRAQKNERIENYLIGQGWCVLYRDEIATLLIRQDVDF